jgi:DNA-binding SARP family transcriptional activator
VRDGLDNHELPAGVVRDRPQPGDARTSPPPRSVGTVRIRLLGGLEVEVDGRVVPDGAWRRRRGAALVKLLALAPNRRLHREQIIDALWPELSVDEAAPRLYKAAHFARQTLGCRDSVVARAELVALFPDVPVTVDAVEFAAAAARALSDGSAAAADTAIELYGGELLPDDLYEPWTDQCRDRLRSRHQQLLRQAQRWDELVAADPTAEDAHVAIMSTLHAGGAHRAALRQFERLERILRDEVGAEPGLAARTLRDQVVAAAAAVPAPTATGQATGSAERGATASPADVRAPERDALVQRDGLARRASTVEDPPRAVTLLLVVSGAEHVSDTDEFVNELLERARRVTVSQCRGRARRSETTRSMPMS